MEVYTPDNLIAGTTQIVTDSVTIASGDNLTRGSVLGAVSADGKFKLSDDAATDGSETPVAILAQDTDASAGDVKEVAVYVKGEFNENQLVFGGSHTPDSVRTALNGRGIFLKTPVKRTPVTPPRAISVSIN